MAKADDFTKYMTEMMQSFPMDSAAMQDAFKSQAALGEKMSKVALDAAGKSSELSAKWTKETLSKMGEVAAVKDEPTDYTKS